VTPADAYVGRFLFVHPNVAQENLFMLVLGLQGSPRFKGNTSMLLSAFLEEAERLGGRTRRIDVAAKKISPCQECGTCEREGFCPIDDEVRPIFSLLHQADIVVIATPVFFYGPTAQLKALIDRSQALWARKYVHKLVDPGGKWRRGLLLSVGATKGSNLFDGIILTAKYFFDAVGASFEESLTYRKIEKAGDIAKHPTALEDVKKAAKALVAPFLNRKKVLFVCHDNASFSQMASAFTQYYAGDRIDVESAGSAPTEEINPLITKVMGEKGIDMAFRKPKSIRDAVARGAPELIVSVGSPNVTPDLPGVRRIDWDLPKHGGDALAWMREVRDDIEERVGGLIREEIGTPGLQGPSQVIQSKKED
jgi:arsenate reductase